MDYGELVKLAMLEGPMQDLAIDALLHEYEADDRVDRMMPRNRDIDPQAYMDAYVKFRTPRMAPVGEGPSTPNEDWARNEAIEHLLSVYDKRVPWYDKVADYAGAAKDLVLSPEVAKGAIDLVRDTVTPGFTQLDSYNWARDEYGAMLDSLLGPDRQGLRDEYGARRSMTLEELGLGAGHGIQALLGAAGTVPGVASVVGGGRKLGRGWRALMESFI